MNDILTIDPEDILNSSKAQFFLVVWNNSQGIFFATGGGSFQNALHGNMASPATERAEIVKKYYNLVRAAKSHELITDGRIDLVELPIFQC